LRAAIGIHGVLSFVVTERRRDIGIRLALAADRRNVLGHIMKEGLLLTSSQRCAASHFKCRLVLRKMTFPKTPECFSSDPRLLKDNGRRSRLLLPNGNRTHPDFGFYLKIAPTPRLTANRSLGLGV
jgi:hypothetical protein